MGRVQLLILAAACAGCGFVVQRVHINLCSNSGLIAFSNISAIAGAHSIYAHPDFITRQMAGIDAGAKHASQA